MSVMAWHFTGSTLRDGRPIPAIGEWLIHEGSVAMCACGLHASRKALDALSYAPGSIAHRVECEDIVDEDATKLVCRRRRIVGTVGPDAAERIMRRFARQCALSVIDKWAAPEIVRRYLVSGDESIRAAARDAAGESAGGAAREAAWGAAAGESAREAAREAAWEDYNEKLEHMLLDAIQAQI